MVAAARESSAEAARGRLVDCAAITVMIPSTERGRDPLSPRHFRRTRRLRLPRRADNGEVHGRATRWRTSRVGWGGRGGRVHNGVIDQHKDQRHDADTTKTRRAVEQVGGAGQKRSPGKWAIAK